MLRCCNKLKRPTFSFKASIGDLIGILFLGGFFGGILFLIAWAVAALTIQSLASGEFWDDRRIGRGTVGSTYVIALGFILLAVPKLLKLLSFFVNFKLKFSTTCKRCNHEQVLLDLPTGKDPF